MAKKKQKTINEQIKDLTESLRNSLSRWCDIRDNGCTDPCWSDGTNMNLVHNHIIYYKKQLMELIKDNFMLYPMEFFIPVPPEVPNDYMRYNGGNRGHYGTEMLSTYERDKPILDKWGSYDYTISTTEIYVDDGLPF